MKFYKNGNYTVCFMKDGTKIRRTDDDEFIPSFAENVDVCITRKCSIGCKFCYESCTSSGRHADLFKYKFIDTLHPYTELSINGNDLDHPQLMDFLVRLKERKVFTNMTVRQEQFMNNLDMVEHLVNDGLIYGIGVSYSHSDERFLSEVRKYDNAVIHVINGITTQDDFKFLKGNGLKVLILGYKDIRKGHEYLAENDTYVKWNQDYTFDTLGEMVKDNWFKVISFDNLAIKQLNVRRLMPESEWNEFYMGDDGKFTFYIDMVNGTFARNSLCEKTHPIKNLTIDEMFEIVRNDTEEKIGI